MPQLHLPQTAGAAAAGSRRTQARPYKPSDIAVDVGHIVCMLCKSIRCDSKVFLCHVLSSVCWKD